MISQSRQWVAQRVAQLSELCPSCPNARARHNSESCAARIPRGFTLVELLLVMFVMSVLVALVVGVGTYVVESERKEETIATQNRYLAALEAYRNVTREYPPTDPNLAPTVSPPKPSSYADSMNILVRWLNGGRHSNPMSKKIYSATKSFLGEGTTPPTTDAYGNPMRYYSDKGLGGKPVILSAGPDGEFGVANTDKDKKKRTDNIRSDTRE
jgi:prepilin-type N-terminal cleavage/methylation domain-containing protein